MSTLSKELLDNLIHELHESGTDAVDALWKIKQAANNGTLSAPGVVEGELISKLRALLPESGLPGWWCPTCKSEVDATFYEYCATCGMFIGNCQPSSEWINTIKSAIEALNTRPTDQGELVGALLKWVDSAMDKYPDGPWDAGWNKALTSLIEAVNSGALSASPVAGDRNAEVRAFADGVIRLITAEQAAMCRLYEKHSYGINKVCNRLKLFVGDLLKPQPTTAEAQESGSDS